MEMQPFPDAQMVEPRADFMYTWPGRPPVLHSIRRTSTKC